MAEADYFTKLNTELAGPPAPRRVMTGAYFIWQYGPPGWMEDLNPWLQNSSATGPDYDFEDIYEGLRTSTRWDFKKGSPLGSGGQWAIPWGFETNVVAYNKKFFDERGIKPADTFDNFIQLANDLTDRSQNRYGVAFRGSKSWASIHPGFMTHYSREGAKDYTLDGGKLQAAMNSRRPSRSPRSGSTWPRAPARPRGPPTSTRLHPRPRRRVAMRSTTPTARRTRRTSRAPAPGRATRLAPGPAGPTAATRPTCGPVAGHELGVEEQAGGVAGSSSATARRPRARRRPRRSRTRPQVGFEASFKQRSERSTATWRHSSRVVDSTRSSYTPQTQLLRDHRGWSVALQEIYAGQDAKSRLDALAAASTRSSTPPDPPAIATRNTLLRKSDRDHDHSGTVSRAAGRRSGHPPGTEPKPVSPGDANSPLPAVGAGCRGRHRPSSSVLRRRVLRLPELFGGQPEPGAGRLRQLRCRPDQRRVWHSVQ